MKRALISALVVFAQLLATNVALSTPSFSVSVDSTVYYNPGNDSFAVSSITLNNAPSYVQASLALTDLNGDPVPPTDSFRIAVGIECNFDNSYTNSDTGGLVSISGDNSTFVIMAGDSADVQAALNNVWIYKADTHSCSGGAASKINQALLQRKLQVTAIETQPGLKWSPQTQHYYQLVTQTTDDGMGQPTDNSGNITDSSRYFVRWSTARANAKASTITINGNTHQGYLASIITKDEFNFLNNNVSGGSGTLYPAWVGGSDAQTEGLWKWVDGPEAKQFGGDTLTHDVVTDYYSDSQGRIFYKDSAGVYYYKDSYGNRIDLSSNGWYLFARDNSGNYIYDSNGNQEVIAYSYYCDSTPWWISTTYTTPDGQSVNCGARTLTLPDGTVFDREWANLNLVWNASGYLDPDPSDGYAHQIDTATLTHTYSVQTDQPNYEGAQFWGPDAGPNGTIENGICSLRGARGDCFQNQSDSNGYLVGHTYYVYWSNGDQWHQDFWDGVNLTAGDGIYSPQPDNAPLNGAADENALVINWCARNSPSYYATTDAVQETLYGNSDYYCTPGWNDLVAGDWGGASNTYPNSYSYDTPNQIGTTDYVVEYCGYSEEAACNTDGAAIVFANFAIDQTSYASGDTKLRMSFFSDPSVQTTLFSSDTMTIENFDAIDTYWQTPSTSVGLFDGSLYISDANLFGGAGLTGRFPTGVDTTLTLPTTQRYLGFWWSAGNSQNYVDLMDANGNVLQTITTADVLAQLGPCDGTNPYCGNPNDKSLNTGEQYAYINLRYPAGFAKVHFYGQGFEFDNLAISVSVPARLASETLVSSAALNLSCADATAESAAATLIACPRTVTIDEGTSLNYSVLSDSQISGYSYPGSVNLVDVYVSSGDGLASISGSDVSLSSNTPGTFYIDYTIDDGVTTAISRITVNVNPVTPPPPSTPPSIYWNAPNLLPTVLYGTSFAPSWSVNDTGSGIGSYGSVVRQVASYAGDVNCMSDWTTDETEVLSDSTDTLSFGHCYRYTFDSGAGGQIPSDLGGLYSDANITSYTLVVPFETKITAPDTIRVDPRSSSVNSPQVIVSGGDVQACIKVTDLEGNWISEGPLYFDLGANGYPDENYGAASLSTDLSSYIVITGDASSVSTALTSIAYRLSYGKYNQSYRIHVDVGPWVPTYSESFGCGAALAQGKANIAIDPYGLGLSISQRVLLTPRN